jgi:hypothetical protein
VVFVTFPWRPIAFAGALAVVAAGVLAAWRAERLPVMSSRFDPPSRPADSEQAEPAVPAGGRGYQGDSATMWESLSRGEDPTGPE